jgi:hypothetical protein
MLIGIKYIVSFREHGIAYHRLIKPLVNFFIHTESVVNLYKS